MASLARYAVTGSLWVTTLMLAVIGDKAPRRVYPAALTVAGAVTTAVITDEILSRRGDHMTESCLAAIEIDRAAQQGSATKVTPLRAAGRGDLAC
jgi:hypothetical protein